MPNMPEYIPLSKSLHSDAGLLPADHSYALQQAVVPLTMEEFPHSLPTMAAEIKMGSESIKLTAAPLLKATFK